MLSVKGDNPQNESGSSQARSTRRGTMVNRRAGLQTALNLAMRTPKPQSLPSYLVKVLLSLVQARLEAKVQCPDEECRKCRSFTPVISPCCRYIACWQSIERSCSAGTTSTVRRCSMRSLTLCARLTAVHSSRSSHIVSFSVCILV